MCVFHESGVTSGLAFSAAVPGGGQCGNAPCWKPKGAAGFRYSSKDGIPEGTATVLLRSGVAGKAVVLFKGKGARLSDRAGGLPDLPLATPLRAQLRGGQGLCVETVFDATGVVDNDPVKGIFKVRGAP
jgi:hypothetical protein